MKILKAFYFLVPDSTFSGRYGILVTGVIIGLKGILDAGSVIIYLLTKQRHPAQVPNILRNTR